MDASCIIAATGAATDIIPAQMLAFGAIILGAHLVGKLFGRLSLPEPVGQLLGGMLAGPWFLNTIGILGDGPSLYSDATSGFTFFVFVFIAVVAFSIGEELHIDRLRTAGRSALIISATQATLTLVLITGGLHFIAGHSLIDAMMMGAIGIATAPAMTFVLLNKLKIEGRLRNVLGSVEVVCDTIGVVIFSLLVQVARGINHGQVSMKSLAGPLFRDLLMAHVLGIGIFVVLWVLVRRRSATAPHAPDLSIEQSGMLSRVLAEHPSPSARIFCVVIGTVSIGSGIAYLFHYPFLVTATFAGFLIANLHSRAIFDSLKISSIAALFNLAFFAIVGATERFDTFDRTIGISIVVYVIARGLGKVLGTRLGCRLVGEDRKIESCLPYLVFPQAGVAAVEAVYAGAILGEPMIPAILLPSIIIFDVGGTLMSGMVLEKWRSWVSGEDSVLREAKQQNPQKNDAARDLLLSILRTSSIALNIKGKTKNEVIKALVEHARSQPGGAHIHEEEALQLISEREKLFSTGMGNGIAIPHCRLLGIDDPIVVWATHEQGVVFGGIDDEPCYLIILILSNVSDPNAHMKLLSATARILGSEEIRQKLLTADSAKTFVEIVRAS